jgi:hypothetical protein
MAQKKEPDLKNEPWKDEEGIVITLKDCADACYLCISLLARDLEFNDKVKDNAQIKKHYARSMAIIAKIRRNFEDAMMAMKRPTLFAPKSKVN